MNISPLVALLALLTPVAAAAQVIDDPEAAVVEALVVNAKLPGPAWWKVSDADTTIYVLGVPPALPKGMAWDQSVLDHRLDGAFALITPPEARAGFTDIPALLKLRKTLKADKPLQETSPALAARLAKAWAGADPKDAEGWRDWKPLGAGILLAGKANKADALVGSEPDRTIGKLARKHRVKTRIAATYKAMPMIKAVAKGHSEATGLACLEEVLDEVEAGTGDARRLARDWAEGNVRGALAASRGGQRCELQLPGVPELVRRATADEATALTEALKTPGHAVATFPLRGLVAENGVLDQLRAKGFTVRTPGD